jgi:hypothetical protein
MNKEKPVKEMIEEHREATKEWVLAELEKLNKLIEEIVVK